MRSVTTVGSVGRGEIPPNQISLIRTWPLLRVVRTFFLAHTSDLLGTHQPRDLVTADIDADLRLLSTASAPIPGNSPPTTPVAPAATGYRRPI